MFMDTTSEDRRRAWVGRGIFDSLIGRWLDRRYMRTVAGAARRLFDSGKDLSFGLGHGKCLSLTGASRCRVTCARGAVWVTATGDGRDRVLTPGQSVTYVRGGKVVITGRGEAAQVRVFWD